MFKLEKSQWIISSSPHIHNTTTISTAMRDVLIALMPALFLALYFFGLKAFSVIVTCVTVAFFSELICQKIMNRQASLNDCSAVVTGLLLAFCLPPGLSWGIAALGALVAIIIGKQVFGGLGNNIFNPALIGRAVLLASWPVEMTRWLKPIDHVTTATPLYLFKEASKIKGNIELDFLPSIGDLFFGNVSGSLGETSALALLIGGVYLILRGHVDWRIPVFYIGTVFLLTLTIGLKNGQGIWFPLFHILSGGLMLGALFMATDWVTSPISRKGKIIFGMGCGMLTVLIRFNGGYPEGVCYAILLMNLTTPVIDRFTRSRVFGR